MKINKIREMSTEELEKEVVELKKELFKLNFALATNGLENPKKIKEVKKTIAKHKLDPQIVYAGDKNNEIVIRTIKALKADQRQEVINTIDSKYSLKKGAVLSSEEFGPTVGKELRHNAVKSVLIATFCMLIYIRFRFKNWLSADLVMTY